MPPTKVEFDDRDESQDWIVDFRHRQQRLRMGHEANITPISILSI